MLGNRSSIFLLSFSFFSFFFSFFSSISVSQLFRIFFSYILHYYLFNAIYYLS